MKRVITIFLLISFSLFGGIFSFLTKNQEENSKLKVFVSILPQKYFVERIGGNNIEVNVLVGPGKSPATYEPTPNQIMKLSSSKILFTIGVPFEKAFLEKIRNNLDDLEIVPTDINIEKRYFKSNSKKKIEDPHIWLNPNLVKKQAKIIYEKLVLHNEENRANYKINYENFITELDELDEYLANTLKPFKDDIFFVFHPSFGYFADEYGLIQESIEVEGKEPTPKVLESIIKKANNKGVKIIFVQPEFSQKSAKAVAESIEGVVVPLNPLSSDYIKNMKSIADKIKGVRNE